MFTASRLRLAAATMALAAASAFAAAPRTNNPLPKTIDGNWSVEVVRKHPDLVHPSVVCTAPDGRIFVAEDPKDMYGGRETTDRILCLHPDGKVTVFAEKLHAVYGMQYLDGKLYVHHVPKFSVFTDDNGVGKDRVELINTTNPNPDGGGGLNDHIPSNFRLGMDGFFYLSTGDKGIYKCVSNVDGRSAEIHGGGVLRIRPDGRDMEVFARGTRNHLDVAVTAEDEIFTYDNTDDGQGWWTRYTHLVDGGFYGYPYDFRPHNSDPEAVAKWKEGKGARPWQPYTLWRIDEFGGGSPCGAIAYNEDALPKEFQGNTFHCEWGKGSFERFAVSRQGGSFKIDKREQVLSKAGSSEQFRPVGVTVTPDGMGFYITDWNFDGWMQKKPAGRLLKLTYKGESQATAKPEWFVAAATAKPFNATTGDLVGALRHPAQSVRLVAQRRAAERGKEALEPLLFTLREVNVPAHAKWHAIWTLDRIDEGKGGRGAIIAALDDGELSVRLQAAKQLGLRKAKEAVPALAKLLGHENGAVRFQAATALGRIGDAAAVDALSANLTEQDLFVRYATFTALNRIGRGDPSAWGRIIKGLASSTPEIRENTVYALRDTYDETLARALATFVADVKIADHSRVAALRALAPLHRQRKPWDGRWFGTQPVNGKPSAKDVEWAGTAIAVQTIRAALADPVKEVRDAAVLALAVAPDAAAGDALAELFRRASEPVDRRNILRALSVSKPQAAEAFIADILKDPKSNSAMLADALAIAKSVPSKQLAPQIIKLAQMDLAPEAIVLALDTLTPLKEPGAVAVAAPRVGHADEKVALAAVAVLADLSGDAPAKALAPALSDKRQRVRRAAAAALEKIKSPAGVEGLLAAVKDPELTKEATQALTATPDLRALEAYLEGLSSKDGGLRDKCRRAIAFISDAALPKIEARLATNPLPAVAIEELQKVYATRKDKAAKLFAYDAKTLTPEAFAAFVESHKGDAKLGRAIFAADNGAGCIKCHKAGEEGGEVGPSLVGVGSKYDRKTLAESILYPSKQILDGYQQTTVRKKNGDIEVGIVRSETDGEVTLVDAAGQQMVIKKSAIERRKLSDLSMMPEGLHTALKPEEFADLVAYLESLKEAKK